MAEDLEVGDVVRVRVWTTTAEQAAVNTLYWQVEAIPFTPPSDVEIADDLDAMLGPLYIAVMGANSKYNGVQVYKMSTDLNFTPFQPAVVTTSAGMGTATGVPLPRQSCGIISWNTRKVGQRYRGRTYLPFPAASMDAGNGTPSTGTVTNYNAIALACANYVTTGTTSCSVKQQLYHHGLPKHVPPLPGTLDEIQGWHIPVKWATQKRRGSYGRANTSPI